MLFIYGGAYLYGFSGDPVYDASYASAKGDVVVVSMNYGVASLGFLAGIRDRNTGEEINGNFGLLDQILAMKRVKKPSVIAKSKTKITCIPQYK